MTISYVTLTEAKEYSKIQHTAMDNTIQLLIYGCSAAVKNYLKDFSAYEGQRNTDDDYLLDSNEEPIIQLDSNDQQTVRSEVKMAVLYWVDILLKKPDSLHSISPGQGRIPPVVEMLLYPLRDPALA